MMKHASLIIPADNGPFYCRVVEERPLVSWKGNDYASLPELLAAAPDLGLPPMLMAYCSIANFFFMGNQFRCINDINAFREQYPSPLGKDRGETQYGCFDITGLHVPRVSKGWLVFFVADVHTGIPYKVVSPYPYTDNRHAVDYGLLPYL